METHTENPAHDGRCDRASNVVHLFAQNRFEDNPQVPKRQGKNKGGLFLMRLKALDPKYHQSRLKGVFNG